MIFDTNIRVRFPARKGRIDKVRHGVRRNRESSGSRNQLIPLVRGFYQADIDE